MRAIVMEGFGAPTQARVAEFPAPQVGPGEVLVRIGAVAINPVDWKELAGMLAAFYPPYPPQWIPGFDGAGLVEKVGAGVTGLAPGDRVLIRPDRSDGNGVLAELAKAPVDKVSKAPEGLSFAQVASMGSALRTAWQAFTRPDVGVLRPAQSVLIEGAAGGVGSYAVAVANVLGARVAGSCRPANEAYVRGLGAEATIDYRDPQRLNRLREWAPKGIDVILDCVHGGRATELLDLLAPGGRLISLATLNNDADVAAVTALAAQKGLSFHFLLLDYDRLTQDMAELNPILAGGLTLPTITSYPLDRAVEALEAMRAGGVCGKIVVTPTDLESETGSSE